MSFMSADHRAQRTADGSITLIVSDAHVMPPLPYELSGLVAHDVWDHRTQTIKELCARFSKPMYERIWFFIAMIATLALPLPLYRLVFNAVFDEKRVNQTFYPARAAGFAIFMGVILVFWAPLAFWKWFGIARMRKHIRQWDTQDRSNANGRFVPEWKVEMPGIFSINGRVTISTPPSVAPSQFHTGAHLPPYINAPAYAPYPNQGPIMPGTVAYNGEVPDRDEKAGFQDVNLKV
ncbi:unnamed protein product [Rhizoctonia solani]|uniref:Transmembrane protein, putative n=1 Tax=Rhizoctonia solani AG-3 Rhs1AP TaxID=1086054 RepID=A0A0A1UI99_9AGAM|nr:transmembrane protein, putative [Rhizoctonia solani AG-3 Rhs1AP]CAE6466936.1 unnamed protein product [Rhizoctonia solani]